MLVDACRDDLVDAAHDLSDGGLAQRAGRGVPALRRRCPDLARRGLRARRVDAFTALFSESAGRVVVAVRAAEEVRFIDLCAAARLRRSPDRASVGGEALDVQGQFEVPLAELQQAHARPLVEAFGG